jgi:hypothetical protein
VDCVRHRERLDFQEQAMENVQVTVILRPDIRKLCEERAAAERRPLSGWLRNLIEDSVGERDDRRRRSATESHR